MKFQNGEQIVIETVTDGVMAADAASFGSDDNIAEAYRYVKAKELPCTLGKWASEDVMRGLQVIAQREQPIPYVALTPELAAGYLGELGLAQPAETSARP